MLQLHHGAAKRDAESARARSVWIGVYAQEAASGWVERERFMHGKGSEAGLSRFGGGPWVRACVRACIEECDGRTDCLAAFEAFRAWPQDRSAPSVQMDAQRQTDSGRRRVPIEGMKGGDDVVSGPGCVWMPPKGWQLDDMREGCMPPPLPRVAEGA